MKLSQVVLKPQISGSFPSWKFPPYKVMHVDVPNRTN